MFSKQHLFYIKKKKKRGKKNQTWLISGPLQALKKKNFHPYLTAFPNGHLIPDGTDQNRPPFRVIEFTATHLLKPFHL